MLQGIFIMTLLLTCKQLRPQEIDEEPVDKNSEADEQNTRRTEMQNL